MFRVLKSEIPNQQLTSYFYLIFIFSSIALFSGAFTDHFIFGSGYGADLSNKPKIINSLMKFPLYIYSMYVIFKYQRSFFLGLIELRYYFLFILLALVSCIWTFEPIVGLTKVFSLSMCMLVGFGLAHCCSIENTKKALAICLIFILFSSLIYIFLIPSLGTMSAGEGFEGSGLVGEKQGVFKHKNIFGSVAAISMLISIFLLDSLKNVRYKYVLFGLSLLCLLLANSMTKVFAIVAVISFVTCFKFFIKVLGYRYSGTAFTATLSLFIVAITLLINVLLFFLELTGRDLTFTGRTLIWEHAIYLFWDKPILGYGISSIWKTGLSYIYTLPFYSPIHSHNSFVEVLLTTGLAGVTLLIFFILKAMKDFVLFSRNKNSVFFLSILLLNLIDSTFEYTMFRGNNILFLMLIFSYFFMLRDSSRNKG